MEAAWPMPFGLVDALGGLLFGLGGGGPDGQGHIGAGIPVGHGEDVELVDALLLRVDGCGAVDDHPLEQRAVTGRDHSLISFPVRLGGWAC